MVAASPERAATPAFGVGLDRRLPPFFLAGCASEGVRCACAEACSFCGDTARRAINVHGSPHIDCPRVRPLLCCARADGDARDCAPARRALGRAFPYAPRLEDLALSFLLYALSLTPALTVALLGPRFARLARLLLGTPFGLLAMSLLFAGGYSSRNVLIAAGLVGFPAGALLCRVGSTRSLAATTALVLVLGAGTRLRPAATAPEHGPSVLFVVLDTTATGHLSAYGYAKPTTPTLDALAQRSLVYRRAVSPASWTVPAHASMFSGLYPSELGFDGSSFSPQHERGSVASDLEASGRTAYAIAANPLVGRNAALRAGYRALWRGDHLTRPFLLRLLDGLRWREEVPTRGDQITDLALDWLDRLAPRGKPWFLFLNYVDPHVPYRPPQRERDEFAPGVHPDLVADLTQRYGSGRRPLTPEVTAAMRALYDARSRPWTAPSVGCSTSSPGAATTRRTSSSSSPPTTARRSASTA